MTEAEAGPSTPFVKPVNVIYCGICSLPAEYCEFGSRISKCKQWLQDEHPHLYARYYSDTAMDEKLSALSLEQREALDKDSAKKEAKAEAKDEKLQKQRQARSPSEREEQCSRDAQSSKVLIKRIERTKRKHVTAVYGLEVFEVDLKKASKLFANRFATGASVAKNAQGEDEIVIQGDVADEVEEMLLDTSPKIAAILGGGRIPEDNIYITDEKKKKAAS
ncbi:uncharacterized protein L969DRAFT_65552 [Mixia osmundae IAM 14324]|uniref:uncharacterized protein n=1 Tax=Mixia osmundae (strain CBS 9802 / IAM 14324 / JCM 22182 / KY 12970) TaxID=764103 RepID=UPI0004A55674|nr:uncharacterized protein L969DRAFT_65552 [Mixia osmundae IAM 14324]KEI37711.1 hypothetical protein L969DRAFT_65552 [Mixia osmundae IAM 14324]